MSCLSWVLKGGSRSWSRWLSVFYGINWLMSQNWNVVRFLRGAVTECLGPVWLDVESQGAMRSMNGCLVRKQILVPPQTRGLACGYAELPRRFHNTDLPTLHQTDVWKRRIPRAHQSRVSGSCFCRPQVTHDAFDTESVHNVYLFTLWGGKLHFICKFCLYLTENIGCFQ